MKKERKKERKILEIESVEDKIVLFKLLRPFLFILAYDLLLWEEKERLKNKNNGKWRRKERKLNYRKL